MANAKQKFISNKMSKKQVVYEDPKGYDAPGYGYSPSDNRPRFTGSTGASKIKTQQISQRDQYKNAMNKAQRNGGSNGVGVGH